MSQQQPKIKVVKRIYDGKKPTTRQLKYRKSKLKLLKDGTIIIYE